MIIDTSFLTELYHAEKINNYHILIQYMSAKFDKQYYTKYNIYTQIHHIIPSFECEDLDKEELIQLPVSIHFRAHILRAREWLSDLNDAPEYAIGNYTEAYCILKKFPDLQQYFISEFNEAANNYIRYYRPSKYEAQFGKKKANIIKRKIAFAMSNLDPLTISKRNESIAKYASNRPISHNENIAKSLRKPVVHIKTNKCYATIKEAALITGESEYKIRKHCKGIKNQEWDYSV